MPLTIGQKSQKDAIYKCTKCENKKALLKGEIAPPCEICTAASREQKWRPTGEEFLIETRNVEKEFKRRSTFVDRVADGITWFCGSMWFVYLHIIWFAWWIWHNVAQDDPFDPFPFGLLTLVVSLEAILLATFILISQNREAEMAKIRSKLNYNVDLKNEKQIAELVSLTREMYEDVQRLRPQSKSSKK